jgi:hypothetical protein
LFANPFNGRRWRRDHRKGHPRRTLTAHRAAQNKKLQNLFKRKKNIFFFLSVLLFSIGESVPLLTARSGPKRWGGRKRIRQRAYHRAQRLDRIFSLWFFFFIFLFWPMI